MTCIDHTAFGVRYVGKQMKDIYPMHYVILEPD